MMDFRGSENEPSSCVRASLEVPTGIDDLRPHISDLYPRIGHLRPHTSEPYPCINDLRTYTPDLHRGSATYVRTSATCTQRRAAYGSTWNYRSGAPTVPDL